MVLETNNVPGSSVALIVVKDTAYAVEYQHGADRLGWIPLGTLGLGINSIDVDDKSGTLSTGGPFTIKIDAGTETVIEGSAGIRYQFSRYWSASASALLQHRIADWTRVLTFFDDVFLFDSAGRGSPRLQHCALLFSHGRLL